MGIEADFTAVGRRGRSWVVLLGPLVVSRLQCRARAPLRGWRGRVAFLHPLE